MLLTHHPVAQDTKGGAVQTISLTIKALIGWLWQRPWLTLLFLAVPIVYPLIVYGLPLTNDGLLHFFRLGLLDQHLQQGSLYPRWMPELAKGFGYPLLNFYAPLTYYLAEGMHLLGMPPALSLALIYSAAVLAGGLGMYRLAADVLGQNHRMAALVAATAYMYAPYLLANVFVRGAIGEVGASALLPWIVWSIRRLITSNEPAPYVVTTALTMGGLAVGHNITLLLFSPMLIGYVIVIWWQDEKSRRRLLLTGVALTFAMAISAFFWLPMMLQRSDLVTFRGDPKVWLAHAWNWTSFLDTRLDHTYGYDGRFRLSIVQVVLAGVGLACARRRDLEWLYFVAVAIAAGVGISQWAVPIWLSSKVLAVAQFPWRLLVIMMLPLSLFIGAILLPLHRNFDQAIGALAIITLIVLVYRPLIDWTKVLARGDDQVVLPAVAQFERESSALGTSWSREFLPRWSLSDSYRPSAKDLVDESPVVSVSRADAYGLEVSTSNPISTPLRLTAFYFPGWRAKLDDGKLLRTYPSTNLGLLTVDVPPGEHMLQISWTGTALHHGATWASIVGLGVLAYYSWRYAKAKWLAGLLVAVTVTACVAALWKPAMQSVQVPVHSLDTDEIVLLGYRVKQEGVRALRILPIWYVKQTPSEETRFRLQLRDDSGAIVSEATSIPYFGSMPASNWPPGTIVDDAYWLLLPQTLPSQHLNLDVQVLTERMESPATTVGSVDVAPSQITDPQRNNDHSHHTVEASFGDELLLTGFNLSSNGTAPKTSPTGLTLARPGQPLTYDLDLLPVVPLSQTYPAYITLVDHTGQIVAKDDALSRSEYSARYSSPFLESDRFTLRIPRNIHSQVLWPLMGVYEIGARQLLPVKDSEGQSLGPVFHLPPIKVLGARQAESPQHRLSLELGDVATLLGYRVELPAEGVRPGSRFDLMLYYRSKGSTASDLTQFRQLYSPTLGMAAQKDSPPLDGANPTWAWLPGEVIVDRATLEVAEDAAAGLYSLQVGLYDRATGERIPIFDRNGIALPDNATVLTQIELEN